MKIEILSREALTELAKEPFAADVAVISITDFDDEDVALSCEPEHILRLKFDDVGDDIFEEMSDHKPSIRQMRQIEQRYHMLSNSQTRQLADFILSRKRRGTLICQCQYGQSRSAGVAAAVAEYYYRRGVHIFADPRYYPNKYIFRKLLRALRTRGGQ